MYFEIQGLKCKKHRKILLEKKKFTQHILFHPTEPKIQECQRAKSSYYSSIPRTINKPDNDSGIILASDLPSLPLYMPKLIRRGKSPLKSLNRSLIKGTRLNVFTPSMTNEAEKIESNKNFFKLLSRSPFFPNLTKSKKEENFSLE